MSCSLTSALASRAEQPRSVENETREGRSELDGGRTEGTCVLTSCHRALAYEKRTRTLDSAPEAQMCENARNVAPT